MSQRFNPPTQLPQRLLDTPLVDDKGRVSDWSWKQFFQKMATPVQVPTMTSGSHAQRLELSASSLVSGSIFYESDRGLYYIAKEGYWAYSAGTLLTDQAHLPRNLTASDAGVLAYVTDFHHLLRWTGTNWTWGPGDSQSGFTAAFVNAPPDDSGWVAADGSDNVAQLLSDGTVDFVTVPNVVGSYFRQ